jgi:hypothetical protein
MPGCCSCLSKFAVMVGAVGVVALSVAVLVATIVYNTMDTVVDGLPTAKYVLFSCFYALTILGIIIGVCGCVGAVKRHRCLLCCYALAILALTALGVAVGIAGLVFFPKVFTNTTCATNNNNNLAYFIPVFNTLYNQAYSIFGTATCPALYPSYLSTYSGSQQALLASDGFVTTPTQSASAFSSAVSSCTKLTDAYAVSLASIESVFGCTGMCLATTAPNSARALHYVFSNVNRGIPPAGSCYSSLVSATGRLGQTVGGIGIGVAAFFLVNVIFVSILCCLDQNRDRDDYDDVKQPLQAYEMSGR